VKKVRTGNQTTTEVRSLPIELWPTADRAAWEEACRPSIRLKRGGAASHMRRVTQRELEKRYGLFLDSLLRSGRFDGKARAGAQVTRDNVDAYVNELKSRVNSVTVYGSIQKLRRMVQLIAPDLVVDWLIAIERELASDMRPKPKWDRVVYTEILRDAGLTLMAEAEIANRPKLTRARMFRNGLMMALLAHCPVRLKNFAALEIGRSFVNVHGSWWIVLTAAETKEKRVDERPVSEELTSFIKRYLEIYRPILARGDTESNALLLAMDGKPMSCASIGELITETSRMTIGVKVNPHLYRAAGVTTLATRVGNKPHAGGALLHHHPGPVTQEHYNRASSISAGRALASVTQGYRCAGG
jgi:site-specific recombinase XerD